MKNFGKIKIVRPHYKICLGESPEAKSNLIMECILNRGCYLDISLDPKASQLLRMVEVLGYLIMSLSNKEVYIK